MTNYKKHDKILMHDAVIEFMWWKDAQLGRPGYMTEHDALDIRKWGSRELKKINSNLAAHSDGACCPFCIASGCGDCTYKKNHGNCSESGRSYREITKDHAIIEQIGVQKISDKIEELFGEWRKEK